MNELNLYTALFCRQTHFPFIYPGEMAHEDVRHPRNPAFPSRRQEPLPDGQKMGELRQERIPAAADGPIFCRKRAKKTTPLCCERTHFSWARNPLIYEELMN
jgi:hypothetical protein